MIGAAAALAAARADAAGGPVLLKTDDGADGYYYMLTGGGVDRFITEYRFGDALPSAVICGARCFELNQGVPLSAFMGYEVRAEDPANPTFPDLSPAGLIATADAGSLGPCLSTAIAPRVVTFGGGSGISWPQGNHYLCAIEPPRGNGPLDFCGVLLDTSSPPQGASKAWSGGIFSTIPWNHFLEENVTATSAAVFRVRYHGNRRFQGDAGSTLVYSRRANAAGSTTDDRLRLTFSIDNNTPLPLSLIIELSANLTGVVPGGGIVPLTSRFRPVGGGGPIVNPISVPPGRTIFRLQVPAALPRRAEALSPLNVPLSFRALDGVTGTQYAFITQDMGLRATPGEPDDGLQEAFILPRSPAVAGDALGVRYLGIDLPRSVPYAVTGVQLVGGEVGGTALPGFDAVEVRGADPVLPNTPDLSPMGLLTIVGANDGVGDIPMGPAPWFRTLDVPNFVVDPTVTPRDLYVQALMLPGTTSTFGAVLGSDRAPARLLQGNSVFTWGAAVPYAVDEQSNHMLRLLLDGRFTTLDRDSGPYPGAAPDFAFESGRFVAIDRRGRIVE